MAVVDLPRRKVHFSITDLNCDRASLLSHLGLPLEEQLVCCVPM